LDSCRVENLWKIDDMILLVAIRKKNPQTIWAINIGRITEAFNKNYKENKFELQEFELGPNFALETYYPQTGTAKIIWYPKEAQEIHIKIYGLSR